MLGNKPETIKSRKDIRELFKQGKKERFFPLTVIYRENNKDENRYLFCTEKGIKRAVDRNRIKRHCRELVSTSTLEKKGLDIAIIANIEFSGHPPSSRKEIFRKAFNKFMQ